MAAVASTRRLNCPMCMRRSRFDNEMKRWEVGGIATIPRPTNGGKGIRQAGVTE